MKWAVRQLCSPTRYLRISQGTGILTSKFTYDFVIPSFFAVVIVLLDVKYKIQFNLSSGDGIISNVIGLLNLLTAFFIAALAAVATFDREGLDGPIKGDPAILRRRNSRNVFVTIVLTHRQFVCYLFGYLSFASLVFLLCLYIARGFAKQIHELMNFSEFVAVILRVASVAIFSGLFVQIIITMLLGIYMLTDRLQFMDDPTL